MIPSLGRIVHYVFSNGDHRPAIIVRIFDENPTERSYVQLQVFVDGSNDSHLLDHQDKAISPSPNVVWRTSVLQDAADKAPGTWHEPERA